MSKLTFEYIKANCVSGETVFRHGLSQYLYVGFDERNLVVKRDCNYLQYDEGYVLRNWSIKQPEREVIELFLTEDTNGVLSTCDKDGRYPDYEHKEMNDTDVTMYRTNRSKEVYRRIYADTFEECTE